MNSLFTLNSSPGQKFKIINEESNLQKVLPVSFEISEDPESINDFHISIIATDLETNKQIKIKPDYRTIDTLVDLILSNVENIDFSSPNWNKIKNFVIKNNIFFSPYAAFSWKNKSQDFFLTSKRTNLTQEKLKKFDNKDLLIMFVNALCDKHIIEHSLSKPQHMMILEGFESKKNILVKSSYNSLFYINDSKNILNNQKIYINNNYGEKGKEFFLFKDNHTGFSEKCSIQKPFNMLASIPFIEVEDDYLIQFSKSGRLNSLSGDQFLQKFGKKVFDNTIGPIDNFGPNGVFGFLKDQLLSNNINKIAQLININKDEINFKIMEMFKLLSLERHSQTRKIALANAIISDLFLMFCETPTLSSIFQAAGEIKNKSIQNLKLSSFNIFKTTLAICSDDNIEDKILEHSNQKMSSKDSQNNIYQAIHNFKQQIKIDFNYHLTQKLQKAIVDEIQKERVRFDVEIKPLLTEVEQLIKKYKNDIPEFKKSPISALTAVFSDHWQFNNEQIMKNICFSKNKQIFLNSLNDFIHGNKAKKTTISEALSLTEEEENSVKKIKSSFSDSSIKELAVKILKDTKFTTNFGFGSISTKLEKILQIIYAQILNHSIEPMPTEFSQKFNNEIQSFQNILKLKETITSSPKYNLSVDSLVFPKSDEFEFVLLKTPLEQQIEGALARNCMAHSHQHNSNDVLLSIRHKVSKESLATIALRSFFTCDDVSFDDNTQIENPFYNYEDVQSYQTGNQAINLSNMNKKLADFFIQFYQLNHIKNKYDIPTEKEIEEKVVQEKKKNIKRGF